MKTKLFLLAGAFAFFTLACNKEEDHPLDITDIFPEENGDEDDLPSIVFNGTTLYVYPGDNAVNVQWGSYGAFLGETAQSDTNGRSNTNAIVAYHNGLDDYYGNPTHYHEHNNGTVAALVCDNLNAYGYDDWYLPAKDELNALVANRDVIGGFSSSAYGSPPYWSSTEWSDDSDGYNAWAQSADDNGYTYQKYYLNRVRCVRRD